MISIDELHHHLFAEALPDVPAKSKALECLLVGLVNHLKDRESIKPTEVESYLIEAWTASIRLAVSSLTKPMISWDAWVKIFHHIAEHRIYSATRARRPDMDGEEKCQVPDCDAPPEEWDHIWPFSWGGPDQEWNFMHLCKIHNRMKSSSLMWFTFNLVNNQEYVDRFCQWATEEFAKR